ncbi:hypothetical protein, variant [Saprolegnia diclina VS20]|uniref:Very-long-chain (3R)-3-hydroxyacyl-CoA dehydratase n=1 Tax=Saprolegnia diclina (strain VS20) TaxID=1156394 RepID=T0Q2F5_SAPDV|nr:hypothetical protein SDRG_14624 [Saprolegnia diclina VS20]XP_008618990.1 hypothetical protein, variant [Saprolegnia diclina VS20]EQC27569.1 hypothetical protein SDRG_14624 [Saprolegnia diclina VS20]EQC27570.1 hypothetical protein, variant [Saprolegnia diclina VS20]|eukprot:XP_008618989.1 hypothetical protein SDRG_14624 [Saprolegnia diclina VS20]
MDHRSDIVQQAEVGINLPLQMLLYYNVIFDAFTSPIWIAVFYHKMRELTYASTIRKYAEICCVCIYLPTDGMRLYLGYSGNLLEKVPHLVGFTFLSVVPQVPCALFLAFGTEHSLPFDEMLAVLHLLFLCAQMYHAYYACRASIRRQTAHFMRLCDHETSAKKVV